MRISKLSPGRERERVARRMAGKIQFFGATGIKARAVFDSRGFEMVPYKISIKIFINQHLPLFAVTSTVKRRTDCFSIINPFPAMASNLKQNVLCFIE